MLRERNLDIWAKLKLVFLDPAFTNLYAAIKRHYDRYSELPSFDDLEVSLREGPALTTLATIKLADEPDISAEIALDALIDQYTQSETVRQLDRFLDKLPIYDTAEIKENLAGIVLALDEKTLTTEGVYHMGDILLFKNDAELARDRVHLGLNNTFDAVLAGVARQELVLIGGPRGSGKSIICSNIAVNQYQAGNVCPYFTIEMIAHETMERNFSILADVPIQNLKQNKLTSEELLRVIKARAGMFDDSADLVAEFMRTGDKFAFESKLIREKKLREDGQMIIIDDRALTLTNLDLHLGKIKSKFGDKFKVAVVDYLNQIHVEGANQFDWQPQVIVSKKMKELARKYDIVMFSPYQIDAAGEARFAKGILDAADIALLMKPHDKETGAISFETTKIRGGKEMKFTSGINWDSLRISPIPIEQPQDSEQPKEQKIKRAGKAKTTNIEKTDDSASDIPPWA